MQISNKDKLQPTRTLIITGFKSQEECEEFKRLKVDSSKLLESYTIPKAPFLFLIFYNLKDSIQFKEAFTNITPESVGMISGVDSNNGNVSNINVSSNISTINDTSNVSSNTSTINNTLEIRYTISKYEIPKKSEECSDKNFQSSVNFLFKDLNVSDEFITNLLRQYGEIREIRNNRMNQMIVEFYDIRDAKRAFDTLNGSSFGNGTIKCRWVWDINIHDRITYIRYTDELLKKYLEIKNERKEELVSKKYKVSENRNFFLEVFDQFLIENLSEVEKIIKE